MDKHKYILSVVYDLDGVLNKLVEYTMEKVGDKKYYCKIKKYSMMENTEIPENIRHAMIKCYTDSKIFEEVPMENGADRIIDIEDKYDNVEVSIHSLCYTEDVRKAKVIWLDNHRKLRKVKRDFQVGTDKNMKECIYIMVEDNILNLIKMDNKIIKILVNRPYNQPEEYGIDIKQHNIRIVQSLNEAIDEVERLVGQYNEQSGSDIAI